MREANQEPTEDTPAVNLSSEQKTQTKGIVCPTLRFCRGGGGGGQPSDKPERQRAERHQDALANPTVSFIYFRTSRNARLCFLANSIASSWVTVRKCLRRERHATPRQAKRKTARACVSSVQVRSD